MRDLLITLIILAPLPVVVFGGPDLGVLLWLWISYMNPHRLTWGFAYDLPFAMIVGVATAIGWLLSREPKRLPGTTITALLVAFALWISLTTLFALAPDLAFPKWDITIKILLGAFLTLGVMRGRDDIHALAWVTTASIAFYGVKGGVFAILTGGNYRVSGAPDSFMADNNQAAVAMLMVFPLLRYLQMNTTRPWLRLGLLIAIGLTLLAVLATYSRGAVIGLAAVALFLWLKSRQKLMIGAILVAAIVIGVSLMPSQWLDRVHSTTDYQEDASAQGRFEMWRHAVTAAIERPLTGGGFGIFSPVLQQRAAHSIYFEVLGEQGFVGLCLFLAIGIVTFRNGTWILKRVREREELKWAADLARMLQVSVVGYAVGGAFLSLGYFDLYYGLVVMMALTRLEVARVLAEPQAASDPASVSPPGGVAVSASRRRVPRY